MLASIIAMDTAPTIWRLAMSHAKPIVLMNEGDHDPRCYCINYARRYAGRVLVFETGTQPLFHLRQVGAAWRAIADAPEIVAGRGNHSGLVRERNSGFLATEVVRRLDANDRESSRLVMSRRGEDPVRHTRFAR